MAVRVLISLSSSIVLTSSERLFTSGLSSLNKLRVTLDSVADALVISSKVKIIVSAISISLSSKPSVEIVILPVFLPANTVMDESETTNSSVIVAVPETVNGISTSIPVISFSVAVNTTSSVEFSSILAELNSKETVGSSSSSVIVIVEESVIELIAFKTESLGVITIVSSASFEASEIALNFAIPSDEPARITISGLVWILIILWLFPPSAIKTFPKSSNDIP